ncbi:ESPR domain-containing protein, partial [Megasphaera elsdenii]|uniref:ESPR domain-containing protein n=1 Tax=Megasphaera elsdenii TaxID=907 RepID=UPI003C6DB06B
MNKIYKVIFNKTKGVYEVVSELAHSHSKPQSISLFKLNLSKILYFFLTFVSLFNINLVYAKSTTHNITLQDLQGGTFPFGAPTQRLIYASSTSKNLIAGHWYFYGSTHSSDHETGISDDTNYYVDLGTSPFGEGSTLSDEQKQIVKDLIKNVDGDQTVNGNQTTTGSSETKGNSTTDGSSTVKGDQTVGGTTNTTNLNVSGDT